ncbi:MAG TPA: hypothetical protein VEI97_19095, partial [bacterium]|nr:hypothetical protein [bacterium]
LGDESGATPLFGGPNPVWYSRLEKALPTWPESAHANKYLTLARSTTSADELKWTGLEALLKEKAARNEKVTRAEVEAHLAQNKLEVEEIELVDPTDLLAQEQMALAQGLPVSDRGPTKYHPTSGHSESLSLPGGKKYRELLIKLPPTEAQRWTGIRPEGGQDFYQSPHWTQHPNVLAHVRFNERMAPDGKRVLHIEEVQSDWHQAGREKGYGPQPTPEERKALAMKADVAFQRMSDLMDEIGRELGIDLPARIHEINTAYGMSRRFFPHEVEMAAKVAEMNRLHAEYGQIRSELDGFSVRRVPDAPFKGNAWQELAMRRMLRYAAEHGYDRVSWTTGLQQTQRYNQALGEALGAKRIDWTYTPGALGPEMTSHPRPDTIELLNPKTGEMIWMGPSA